jgi:hypothetical protein
MESCKPPYLGVNCKRNGREQTGGTFKDQKRQEPGRDERKTKQVSLK